MRKEEIRVRVRRLANKYIYLDICDFIDVVYTHFEKIAVYDYKTIDEIINEFKDNVIVKNN